MWKTGDKYPPPPLDLYVMAKLSTSKYESFTRRLFFYCNSLVLYNCSESSDNNSF